MATEKLKMNDFIAAIEKMTVIELAELVKALEEKFGVTAQAPVAVAAPQGAPAGAEGAVEEKTEFSVFITAIGDKKILVEKGHHIYLAVVLHGNGGARIPQRMRDVLDDIEKEYGAVLLEWDGDLDRLRGVKVRSRLVFDRGVLNGLSRRDNVPGKMDDMNRF